jgi:hypothetical protein
MVLDTNEFVLTDQEHAQLKERMVRFGEVRTAETLRLSRMTVLRLLARQPVRLGSISLARIGLNKAV